jgi:naphtho-gamma-pyrone polyketide synthase
VAQTLGSYLIEKYQPKMMGFGIDVRNMAVPTPLIVKNEGEQLIRASMKADWTTQTAVMNLYSVNLSGKRTSDHANCIVQFADCNVWAQEWRRNTYLIHRSIEALQRGVEEGQNHRIRSGMAYKLFASLVEYNKNYKGMQEIILDSEQYEATAKVKFQVDEGNFHRNPFWIDSLGQLTGFVVNANDATPKDMVYVNHGWTSMRCLKPFSAKSQYRTYVRMQPMGGNLYSGDLYALEDNVIIAIYEGVKVSLLGVPLR